MTDYAAPLADSSADQHLPFKFAILTGIAALADLLFYDQRVGLSFTVFAVTLICVSLGVNYAQIDRKRARLAGIIVVAGLVPAIEELNLLSFLFATIATISGLALLTNPTTGGLRTPFTALRQLSLVGPFCLVPDLIIALRNRALTHGLLVWFMPLAFGLVFVLLFAAANPLIAQWLDAIRPDHAATHIDTTRTLFWFAILSFAWPFIHLRWRQKAPRPNTPATQAATSEPSARLTDLFGPATILRALILFNLLFAVQTGLDLVYLWGHAALPDGMTYASYAHRGAYPLIVTALLAAAFVLIAIRPGDANQTGIVRPLVYLWIGQTIMLVLSSIWRVRLYIDIYLLTYWRLAALIWMGLVAVGLILITVRIALDRSHRWLIRMNLTALVATLYMCSLINFDAIIADYDVAHSREAGGAGAAIDGAYLASLGPQALPALNRAVSLRTSDPCLSGRRNALQSMQADDMASWKTWGFRSWRLQHYLNTHPASSAAG